MSDQILTSLNELFKEVYADKIADLLFDCNHTKKFNEEDFKNDMLLLTYPQNIFNFSYGDRNLEAVIDADRFLINKSNSFYLRLK